MSLRYAEPMVPPDVLEMRRFKAVVEQQPDTPDEEVAVT